MGGGAFSWHLLCVGIWSGVVAAKTIMTNIAVEKTDEVKTALAKIDYHLGMCIELPMVAGVFFSGWKLIIGRATEKTFMLMSALGATAIACSVASFEFSKRRYLAAAGKDWTNYDKYNHWQNKLGHGVLHSLAVSLGLGLYLSLD